MSSKQTKSKPSRRPRPPLGQRLNPIRIVRPHRLAELLGVNPSTIWRWQQTGVLPPPIRVSDGVHGWLEAEISELLESRRSVPEATDA